MRPRAAFYLGWFAPLALLAWVVTACGPAATPAYFVPPTAGDIPVLPPDATNGPVLALSSTPAQIPTILVPTPTPPCTDGLTYVQDLTIPDGTNFAPGQQIDKQWLVSNSGTCNWDDRYRLKLIGGDAMGASPLLALFPARAGTQATIRIIFTAPQQTGLYQSQWQAMSPEGLDFGDAFYISIAVSP